MQLKQTENGLNSENKNSLDWNQLETIATDEEQISKLPSPMKWQRKVLASPVKNKILRVGRRAGKTELIIRLSVAKALLKPFQNIAIVSTNYNQAKNVIFKRFEDVKHSSWDL